MSENTYSEAYRHFDGLIWQVPSWATVVFFGVFIAVQTVPASSDWGWCLSRMQMVTLVLCGAFLFHLLCFFVLFSFRWHQAALKAQGPFANWPLPNAQFLLQLNVGLQETILVSLFLQAVGRTFWSCLVISGLVFLTLTIVCEIYIWKYRKLNHLNPAKSKST
jgi:hypothetical protein